MLSVVELHIMVCLILGETPQSMVLSVHVEEERRRSMDLNTYLSTWRRDAKDKYSNSNGGGDILINNVTFLISRIYLVTALH